jgi:hypothetical protein
MLSSVWSRWAWSRCAVVACSSRPAACPTDLVKYLVTNVTASFLCAAENAFDVDLLSEADDVGGFREVLTRLVKGR